MRFRYFVFFALLALGFAWEPGRVALAQGEDPRVALAASRVKEQDILGDLDRIDRQLQGLTDEIANLQVQVDQVDGRRMQAEDELSAAQANLDLQARDVGSRCVSLYRLNRRGLARVLFGSESPNELRRRSRYLLAILQADRSRLRDFMTGVARKRGTLERVDQDRAIIAALQAELRIKEATLRDERARRLALLDDIRQRKDLASLALSQRVQAADAFASSLEVAPSEVPTATENAARSTAAFRALYGKLPWPTSGTLLRDYGNYTDPLTGREARNQGIDIDAAYGTPFRAVSDGVVTKAGFIRGFGQTVVLDHGSYSTVYAHANGLRVGVGQVVHQGEVLGFVGNSGLVDTSGYRLHFEVRYNATPQDPREWLTSSGGPGRAAGAR